MSDRQEMPGAKRQLEKLSLTQLMELRAQSSKRRMRTQVPPLVPQERGRALPASYGQESLWFLDQLGFVGAAYNVPMMATFEGELDIGALARSLSELIRRHESLRTHFESVQGSPIQVIDPPWSVDLHVQDLSAVPESERQAAVQKLSSEEAQHPFNLATGPLVRASLLRVSDRRYALLLTIHHTVVDGWSWSILFREINELYLAYSKDLPSPLPALRIQYADYAIWQRSWLQGDILEEQLQYWRKQLAGLPPRLDLPTDRPRPRMESFNGAMVRFGRPRALYTSLKEFGRSKGATLFMVCLAVYQLLLSRWSGQQDVVVGTPIAGRRHREIEGLIGYFVNTLVLRTVISDELSFRQLLDRVREVTLGAYAHQDLPFGLLVKELRPERTLSQQPIIQVMLELENEERIDSEFKWNWADIERRATHFDLTLYLHESSDGLSGSFEYATDLFDRSTIERMAIHFQTLLERIVEQPECSVSHLLLFGGTDKAQVLTEWNTTNVEHQRDACVDDVLTDQARCTPADRVDDLCRVRLMERITKGGAEMEELLAQVSSMSDSRVQELLVEFATRAEQWQGRPHSTDDNYAPLPADS